jgi:hypothetical protein
MAEPGLELDIDISEINELIKQFPEFQGIVFNEVEVAMVSSLFKFQELIQGNTPVGVSGNLRQSFIPTKPILRGQVLSGNVSTPLPYGLPIERGRTPGSKMPPVDAIELWVRRKLGVTEDSRGVAFVVARKIAKSGFRKKQGYRMVEQAFEDGSPQAIKLFNAATEKAVDKIEKRIEAID